MIFFTMNTNYTRKVKSQNIQRICMLYEKTKFLTYENNKHLECTTAETKSSPNLLRFKKAIDYELNHLEYVFDY